MKKKIENCSTQTEAIELMQWSKALISDIERGDMVVGIVSIDRARMIPLALGKALDLGVAEAGILLADWFARSPVDKADIPAAENVLLKAIALGADEACVQLMEYRWFYRRNTCAEPDAQYAFSLLEKWCAKNENDGKALYLLGLVTCHGFGTEANAGRSAGILANAVSLGNPDALFELFIYHANGTGVKKDEAKATDYLLQAAEAGQLRAMYNLGAFHASGRYVKQDMALAVEWYARAADAGHAKAAEALASMYENGLGVERNEALAKKYWEMLG